jgi:outer membrane protein assembly factor BamB
VAGNLIAVDINTGEEKWRFKLKASVTNLKQTYAQPILVDGILYAVSRNSLHAIDFATGEEKWKAKIGKSTMPQLELVDNLIIGRMGGSFSNGKDTVQQKPFGAFAVDIGTGKLAWKWTKAKYSVTNFRVMPELGMVMLADKKKFYALDLHASKKGKVIYDEKLEFKRKMGSADLAAKGIGAVGGFLGGGLAGGFKSLAGGSDRGDPPLDIELYGDQLIIRAQYHVLAHNIETRATDWSIEFAPPGMSPFALIAMGAVTTAVAVGSAGPTRAAGGGWQSRSMLETPR